MDSRAYIKDWRTAVTYSTPGPQPTFLVDEPELRVLVAGLERVAIGCAEIVPRDGGMAAVDPAGERSHGAPEREERATG